GAVPIVELDASTRCDRDGVDRPPGVLCEFHHAKACDTCDLWDVGGHGHIVALVQRGEHLGKGCGAALAVKLAVRRAGPPNSADVQAFGGPGVDLAVAVTGYQNLRPMARVVALHERRHEMLAMPHRDDRGHLDRFVDITGHVSGPARLPNK